MAMSAIEQLLKQTMGLEASSVGASVVRRAVQERMTRLGLDDRAAYLELLQRSTAELQELIEAVIVPETWFFRDREAFAALARLAQAWRLEHTQEVLRLLSLPCSTGEEPYSMAMALLDAGLPPTGFAIDAIDISLQAIARATRAEYGKNSFRGDMAGWRDRYFTAAEGGYRLHEAVRRQVRFRQGNLFAADLLPGVELYDVVFCRNVLIYFDAATQTRALAVLGRVLRPDGLLFVGASESALLLQHGFASVKLPMAFAFRRQAAAPPREERPRPAPTPPPRRPPSKPVPAAKAVSRPPAMLPLLPPRGLDEATQLANQGRLAEAAQLCERHLQEHGPSAPAFYLLGLVAEAAGNPERAGYHYRKALYLDPAHQEALIHLATLLEQQGDAAGARPLLERVKRLQAGAREQRPDAPRH